MDQRVINLYDRFTHGGISRREFLDRLADLTGSAAAAAAVLPLLQSNPAKATVVAADDPRLVTETSTTTPVARR
jgi:carboxymethylenebutenolidase